MRVTVTLVGGHGTERKRIRNTIWRIYLTKSCGSIYIYDHEKSAGLTCVHCDLCARQALARPSDRKDRH